MRTLTINCASGTMELPKIILGSSMFGTGIDEQTSFALMDQYAELGGFCLDTASVYGDWHDTGEPISEQTIGKWLKQSAYRDKMKIITKGGHYKLKEPHISRVSAVCIEEDIQKSLASLQVDDIDVYFLHRDNVDVPVSELMPVLHKYVAGGFIKAIGASNWSLPRIVEANAFAKTYGLTPFTVSQIRWSLAEKQEQVQSKEARNKETRSKEEQSKADSNAFHEVLPVMTAEEYAGYIAEGIPVLAWSPQASGIVSKVIASGWDGISEQLRDSYDHEHNRCKIENVKALMEAKGVSATEAALGYITCNPLAAAAIIGPSKLEQLRDSMTAADLELSVDEVERLTR